MRAVYSDRFQFSPEELQIHSKWKKLVNSNAERFDLTVSNPTRTGLSFPETEILSCFQNSKILDYQPDPRGSIQCREIISEYYQEKGRSVDPEDIFLTSGSSESFSFLLRLFCNPGDEIICFSPSYPLMEYLAFMENVMIRYCDKDFVGTDQEGFAEWKINFDRLEGNITERTKMIIVVQPNNPSGEILEKEELRILEETAERRGIILVFDEVFSDYIFKGNKICLETTSADSVFLGGISKSLGLPQMKLSWMYLKGSREFRKKTGDYLEIITDSFLSVGTPVQAAFPELWKLRKKLNSVIQKRLKESLGILKNIKYPKPLFPSGGWYIPLLYSSSILTDDELAEKLVEERFTLTHPGTMFGGFRNRTVLAVCLLSYDFQKEGCLLSLSADF